MRVRRLIPLLAVMALIATACGGEHPAEEVAPELAYILSGAADSVNAAYDNKGVTPPDGECRPLRVRRLRQPFGKLFNDSNYRHLEYARAGGITPPDDGKDIWHTGAGVVRVHSSKYVFIDSLSHSYPFLMPHAAALLDEIGHRFADSLAAHGGGAYRLKVTSLLRTPMTVGKLRRVNRNATSESAHRYATTFDISYSKFICDDDSAPHRTFEDLKNLLAVIIDDLRTEDRCLVKHERKQACFHITAAPPQTIQTE